MRRRSIALWAALAAVLALAGCESPGFSNKNAELARRHGEVGFAVLEKGDHRAVFAVNGRKVAVVPPKGYCLDQDSLSVTKRSAFALVADCLRTEVKALAEDPGGPAANAFPAILTITVSGETAFGAKPGAMSAFEALLGTPAGGRLLGRGEQGGTGRVVAAKRVDGALYVLVEERQAQGSDSIFAPRFWRAFTEINNRLVLVTVSCFNAKPLGDDRMLGFLASQIAALRAANDMSPGADGPEIANEVLAGLNTAPEPAATGKGTRAARSRQAPAAAPMAPRRPG